MLPLKDELLRRLAEHDNVAQFLSFGPGQELPQRHSCVRGHRPGHRFPGPEEGSPPSSPCPPAARSTSAASRPGRPEAGRSSTA